MKRKTIFEDDCLFSCNYQEDIHLPESHQQRKRTWMNEAQYGRVGPHLDVEMKKQVARIQDTLGPLPDCDAKLC